jgi:methionine--tRNA ligase beta chain
MSVTMKDFERLDIRAAKLVAVESIPGMKKIMKAKVDLGDRTVSAIVGGAEYYKPSDLEGKLVAVVANLEPRTVAGVKSECMLLAADDRGKPIWLTLPESVFPGTKIR